MNAARGAKTNLTVAHRSDFLFGRLAVEFRLFQRGAEVILDYDIVTLEHGVPVLWPDIFFATSCGTPACTISRTALRRKSWKIRSTPAFLQAERHDFRNSPTGCPPR